MLRNSLRLLQRVAAQQVQQGACASGGLAAAGSGPLSGLAVAMQRMQVQQPSWAAASALGGARQFAAGSSGGGEQPPAAAATTTSSGRSSSSEEPPPPAAAAPSDGQLSSESGALTFPDVDAALEAWGKAMDDGDWGAAWDIFEGVLPVETDEFPALEELLEWDPHEEVREQRRKREAAIKEAHAARWVRRVDPVTGRSYGVGKRKTSVALVWLKEGKGHMMVNRRPYDQYFPDLLRRNDLMAPFLATGTVGQWDVMVRVRGGGQTGQAQAVRHGIARALQAWNPAMRPALKVEGLLARDARKVERKKPGLKKARKAFQWVKR